MKNKKHKFQKNADALVVFETYKKYLLNEKEELIKKNLQLIPDNSDINIIDKNISFVVTFVTADKFGFAQKTQNTLTWNPSQDSNFELLAEDFETIFNRKGFQYFRCLT